LEKVRGIYPSALSATADSDDLRAIAALQAKAQSNKTPPRRPAAAPAVAAANPIAASPAPPPAVDPVRTPGLAPTLALTPAPALALAPEVAARRAPSGDAVRADLVLTQLEAREESAMGWFVIQLMLAENPIDVDQVPKHDIFKAYRLYSVAGLDQGRVMHALRLGFFKEQSAAQAVASYLGTFYEQPSVKRVTGAERDRFADRRVDPRRDAGPGAPATIEITDDRYGRPKSVQGSASAKSR
jgi:hypothetical protein